MSTPTGTRLQTRGAVAEEQTRELNVRTLQVRASTLDEQTRSVEAVLATETPADVMDWRNFKDITEILVIDGARFHSQVPLLNNHNRWDINDQLGSVRGIRKQGDVIIGRLHFAEGLEEAEKAWQLVRQGHADAVSIGYRVDDAGYVDIAAGATAEVNGRTFTAPADSELRVSFAWELKELSVVHIGADPNARIREARRAATTRNKETVMDPFRTYLESIGLRKDATDAEMMTFYRSLGGDQFRAGKEKFDGLSDERRKALGAAPPRSAARAEGDSTTEDDATKADGEGDTTDDTTKADGEGDEETPKPMNGKKAPRTAKRSAPAQPVDADAVRKEERERVRRIQALDEGRSARVTEIVGRGVEQQWSYEQTAAAVLEAERGLLADPVNAGIGAPAGHVRSGDVMPDALSASVLMRGGLSFDQLPVPRSLQGEARRSAQGRLAEQADRYRHYSMLDIVHECLGQRGGRHLSPDDAIREFIGMERARQINHFSQRASTGTFSGIFSTVFDVSLMASYEAYPDTTAGWVQESDNANFQTVDRVLGGKGGGLKKLARGDTAKDDTMGDDTESYKIARYAKKFVLDEQDIIDDRVDLLMQYPREAAEASAQLRPDLVYYILLSNPTLNADSIAIFHSSSHGANLLTGALNIANLEAARAVMAKQTMNGRTLNLNPRFLLCPQDLWGTAMQLLRSTEVRSTLAATSGGIGGQYGTDNYIRDLQLQLRVDNRMGVAGVTDPATGTAQAGTATNWALVGDRNTIEVGYRRGTGRRPVVRSFVLDQGQWGVGWDVNMDIGAKALDYRSMVFSSGAS